MDKIQLNLVFEILGRPAEHIVAGLNSLITKLAAESGVVIKAKTIHEPVLAKDSKDLYTTFAEVTLEIETIAQYFGIIFTYMPSHVEFTYPEKIVLRNDELSQLGTNLMQRLHDYDAITKRMLFERDLFVKKLKEVNPEEFEKLIKAHSPPAPEETKTSGKQKKEKKKKSKN